MKRESNVYNVGLVNADAAIGTPRKYAIMQFSPLSEMRKRSSPFTLGQGKEILTRTTGSLTLPFISHTVGSLPEFLKLAAGQFTASSTVLRTRGH
jgi:hypothetical protein